MNPYDLAPTHNIMRGGNYVRRLTNDIARNGMREPIEYFRYNDVNYIYNGHHRVLAAKTLGWDSVPVRQVELSPTEAAGAAQHVDYRW